MEILKALKFYAWDLFRSNRIPSLRNILFEKNCYFVETRQNKATKARREK